MEKYISDVSTEIDPVLIKHRGPENGHKFLYGRELRITGPLKLCIGFHQNPPRFYRYQTDGFIGLSNGTGNDFIMSLSISYNTAIRGN
jgi:hypothetical protein